MPKLDSTTIHGMAATGALVADQVANALNQYGSGAGTNVAVAALIYGLLHIFLPQDKSTN